LRRSLSLLLAQRQDDQDDCEDEEYEPEEKKEHADDHRFVHAPMILIEPDTPLHSV
jgi:hypothetical protein